MIHEWNWQGVDFDGLHPGACDIYEAKHGYEGFFCGTMSRAEGDGQFCEGNGQKMLLIRLLSKQDDSEMWFYSIASMLA